MYQTLPSRKVHSPEDTKLSANTRLGRSLVLRYLASSGSSLKLPIGLDLCAALRRIVPYFKRTGHWRWLMGGIRPHKSRVAPSRNWH